MCGFNPKIMCSIPQILLKKRMERCLPLQISFFSISDLMKRSGFDLHILENIFFKIKNGVTEVVISSMTHFIKSIWIDM